jgi:hypothetical protein
VSEDVNCVAYLELAGQFDARDLQLAVVVGDSSDRVLGHVCLLSLWRALSIAAHVELSQ